VNVSGDAITHEYDPGDTVAIVGAIDQVEDTEDVTVKFKDPSGDVKKNQNIAEEDDGYFDYAYDIPTSADDGVWSIEAEYSNDKMYSYFIVDDDSDTINVVLDKTSSIYEAGDEVTISGSVDNEESGTEPNVLITVLDPTNAKIVNQDEAELGDSSLAHDEFEYSFDLENDASHGRYAVIVTYDIDGQEGSTLFEIIDEDSGGGSDFSGDNDSDGDLSAQIEKDSYEPGDNVAIEGTIDNYDSGDNEDLAIVVENPDGDEVNAYGDDSANVGSNGDFDYDFDLDDNADEGTYAVTISYASDEVTMTLEVQSAGGGSGTSDLTAKLNKASYLAGETMTVSGTVADVADPEDGEQLSIFIYQPAGQVILAAGSSKYLTPSTNGAYSGTIVLPSDLKAQKGYKVKVSYLGDTVEAIFDITGVSDTPSDKITVETDKDKYSNGSTVKISGQVPNVLIVSGEQVLIQVNTPDGNPCRLDPIDLPSSGSYSYSLVLGGKCGVAGNYKVEAIYNNEKSATTFELIGSPESKYDLKAGSKTYPIQYELTSGSITSMSIPKDAEGNMLTKIIVWINAEEDGKLTLVLPREVIDAIENNEDIPYVVTSEDKFGDLTAIDVKESENTDDERTLLINYEAGTDRIQISGTQVVPEFGEIAAIVMAIAIIGIIVGTASYPKKFSLFKQ
jgi:uncharacterized protein YfaS (alpha-2-macroglobulin family)